MGHYDDAYDETYAELRRNSLARRQAALPVIIASLDAAHAELSRRVNDIVYAPRMIDDIGYALALLREQSRPC